MQECLESPTSTSTVNAISHAAPSHAIAFTILIMVMAMIALLF